MELIRKGLVYTLLLALLVLGGCGGDEEPTVVVLPTQEPTPAETVSVPAVSAQTVDTPAPSQSMQSPLSSPVSTPLPALNTRQYAKPDRPYLLFYSSNESKPGWYLYDLEQNTQTFAPFQEIPGYTVRNAFWLPELHAFVLQRVDSLQQSDLYLHDFSGALIAPITADPIDEGAASVAPNSEDFAFVCVQNDLDICTSRLGGAGWANLTNIRTREVSPQWSPDGQQIMFLSDAAGISNIWLMNPDGSERRNLSGMTLGTDLVVESNASWSPDGKSILFETIRDENLEIYTVSPEGTDLKNLTNNPAADMNPVWSPDGSMVAFQSDRDNGMDVYVLDLASQELVNISNSPAARENNYIWSPDGSQLYFDSNEEGNFDIFVVNRDGSDKQLLINNPADDVDPQWINP
ncbi:MAG: hypothetical protein WBO46_10565 [Caldilineaceae bacterium]